MKTIITSALFICILLCGCVENKKSDLVLFADSLNEMIKNANSSKDSLIYDFSTIGDLPHKDSVCIIYILNGGCSTCIADYLLFVASADSSKLNCPINTFIYNGDKLITEHYIIKTNVKYKGDIFLFDDPDNKLSQGNDLKNENLLLIRTNKIIKKLYYASK